MWHTFRGGGPRFVTVCDRGEGGGQKSSKIAWHTLWTAPNSFSKKAWRHLPSYTDVLGLGLPNDNNFPPITSIVSLEMLSGSSHNDTSIFEKIFYCRCWENLKRRVRDTKTEEKRDLFATGGGPATQRSVPDEFMNKVEQLIPYVDEQVNNCFKVVADDVPNFNGVISFIHRYNYLSFCEGIKCRSDHFVNVLVPSLPEFWLFWVQHSNTRNFMLSSLFLLLPKHLTLASFSFFV